MKPQRPKDPAVATVVIVGGGLSGALCSLKLSRARPDLRVVVIEPAAKVGRGLAYGACRPRHLLNVPVHRMEVGLSPSYAEWLSARPAEIAAALEEADGDLVGAFTARAQFGAYLHGCFEAVRIQGDGPGLAAVRGSAVALLEGPQRGVRLEDGREIKAAAVVLAIGNLPPQPPAGPDMWFYDTPLFAPDPWAPDVLADIDPKAPLLLIGTGLTMVDVVLSLADSGHVGPMLAVSRHGLAPQPHRPGGSWPPFLQEMAGASPRAILRRIRGEVAAAEAGGVPWQRVFDAGRPSAPAIWSRWSQAERRQFLRHLRARWDVRRHRIAPRVAAEIAALRAEGRLEIAAARVAGYRIADRQIAVTLAGRARRYEFAAAKVLNCTGPATDFRRRAMPLIEALKARGWAVPDRLGLGLETIDSALLRADGRPSDWLYALGPLTRPAWWEITATPEIAAQVDRLVARFTQMDFAPGAEATPTAEILLDLGAGI